MPVCQVSSHFLQDWFNVLRLYCHEDDIALLDNLTRFANTHQHPRRIEGLQQLTDFSKSGNEKQ